ncbi:MAG TPA: cytochrome c [Thermoanaerobaculia bacterium]|nr:cytochrome c [Thermoanaerobaculia bacterium]
MRRSNPRRGLFPLVALAILAAGCRQDMHDAPRYDPLERSSIAPGERSARDFVPGTIARGHLRADTVYYSGKNLDGSWVTELPPRDGVATPIDRRLLERGRERFDIFCSPCHSRVGDGNGMIVRRGYKQAGNFHVDRLRTVGVGYFYDVMTNGFGQMPAYAAQIKPEDRWAIAAYVRALQFAQHARLADLPGDARQALSGAPATEGQKGPAPGSGWGGFGSEETP